MICSGEVYDGEGNIVGRGLHLENGRIVCISQAKISAAQSDYSGRYIVPGFVDTHCHGGAGTIADQFRGLSEIDFSRLIRACVSVPANACGIQNDIGVTFDFSISSSPNFLILDDERNILHVFRDGQLVR